MNTLLEARQYEQKYLNNNDITKPNFHMTSPIGWMNDPNGFSKYKDEYHLFFQYYPYSTKWGLMHWGHCTTKDFIKWQYLPATLAPDETYDNCGCFSGSAIEENGQHILVYTGVFTEKEGNEIKQVQCIASGDGVEYKKWDCNPIITPDQIPVPVSEVDFRDPKIWKWKDRFYLVVACCDNKNLGKIALFSSEDLYSWQYENMLAENDGSYGRMWECPDFFPLDDTYVLIASPQDMRAKGLEFHNGNGSVYFSGGFDYETYDFVHGEARMIDYGLDFYAPQTVQTTDGRRIMIGWMQSWDSKLVPDGQSWNGMMTIPRELHIVDGQLIQTPIREIEQYYTNAITYTDEQLEGRNSLKGIEGRTLDLELEVTEGNYQSLEIHFAKDEEHVITCKYEPDSGVFTFDRTYSGLRRDAVCVRQMKIDTPGSRVKFRILLDKYSAEIFVNDGRQVMSGIYYTPLEATGIEIVVEGNATANIVKHDIC